MRNKLKQLLDRLVENARLEGWMMSGHPKKHDHRKPGEKILNLSPEDRELLKEVTKKDLDVRVDYVTLETFRTPGRKGRLGRHLEEERAQHARRQLETK